jgi:hypothetical protein
MVEPGNLVTPMWGNGLNLVEIVRRIIWEEYDGSETAQHFISGILDLLGIAG